VAVTDDDVVATAAMLGPLLLAHGYLWWRLVRNPTRPGACRRWLTLLLVALASLMTFVAVVPYPPAGVSPLQWVGFAWLGLAFYAVLTLLVLEPVRAGIRWWQRRGLVVQALVEQAAGDGPAGSGRRAAEESRRLFLARGIALVAGAGTLGVGGFGFWQAQAAPVVRRLPVGLARLDPALEGLRLVAFSDVHISSWYGAGRLEQVVEVVSAQHPDVVAIVGDLVDGRLTRIRDELAPLAALDSGQGTFFVTGNHEYLAGVGPVLEHLDQLGIRTLRNERVAIGRGQATVDLAGVDGIGRTHSQVPGHGADLAAALDGRDASTPVILLAHDPALLDQARAAGVDLQLSGHTHGGQLWPLDYAVRLQEPVVEGYSRHGGTQLYVTSGVGAWGPPMRVGARPEIVVVDLHAG
jgi:predicted MPP superfamily phosphohydrolase